MKHFVLPGIHRNGEEVALAGGDAHYLTRVLRLTPGSTVDAIDRAGTPFVLRIVRIDRESTVARVTHRDVGQPAPVAGTPPYTVVYQSLPKGRRMDDIIRDVTQAGAREIRPLITERTIVSVDERVDRKLERWARVAREAAQQSGAAAPVAVGEPVRLDRVELADGLNLVLHPQPLAQTSLHGYLGVVPDRVGLFIGPEGGFSDGEIELLLQKGASPLWLGPQVYRTELAAFAALAAIRIVIVERLHWQTSEA
ncbi:MAG: 16S rRNA (uracil(1498)-N(3))-methyltransferase [Spirochaetaceae bacterium]|nr:MAG: 16S rRNA (uracil(1498)-N(3))-methyltransferase [Spirochaetaceae bacterium]